MFCCCPTVLVALLALADSSKPAKLQEAVADSLCALAAQDWTRTQLIDAGDRSAVTAAPPVLHAYPHVPMQHTELLQQFQAVNPGSIHCLASSCKSRHVSTLSLHVSHSKFWVH
jgi:hypothetical protein